MCHTDFSSCDNEAQVECVTMLLIVALPFRHAFGLSMSITDASARHKATNSRTNSAQHTKAKFSIAVFRSFLLLFVPERRKSPSFISETRYNTVYYIWFAEIHGGFWWWTCWDQDACLNGNATIINMWEEGNGVYPTIKIAIVLTKGTVFTACTQQSRWPMR